MASPLPFTEIDVNALAEVLSAKPSVVQLIDVREPQELALAAIAGFTNLPLSQFSAWQDQIHSQFEADQETIVLCHHGMRSAQMCQWLSGQGFTQVKNVVGGIDAYSAKVDPAVPRY
ncbi:MAG: rhodanese-like domain-containing protein [Cyanobacteria bacterium]|nr:rhodanese-like domain-containing protein [Cyanobacteriota bacterium]MDA0866572.1 rhodanese-like domain-containing protein [Cyanobacteriota bacterium]